MFQTMSVILHYWVLATLHPHFMALMNSLLLLQEKLISFTTRMLASVHCFFSSSQSADNYY